MALIGINVVVGGTATLLFTQDTPAGTSVTILNTDASVNLLLGSSDVSRTSYGHLVAKGGDEHVMYIPYGESIYGITASGTGTITVHVLAFGQTA